MMTDACLTPAELDELEARYAPTVVPPCRVCGAELTVSAMGGGNATRWNCSTATAGSPNWLEHFRRSEFVDGRRGGDPQVLTLVAEVRDRRATTGFKCTATLVHGLGHQSTTRCQRRDPHGVDDEHYVVREITDWTGAEYVD